MNGYLISLFMGVTVGAAYGLAQVRSPAPPMIALVGLFGMVLGQQAIDMTKRHFARSTPTPSTLIAKQNLTPQAPASANGTEQT